MRIEKSRTQKEEILYVWKCDICGRETNYRKCAICGKEICSLCSRQNHHGQTDNPTVYCKKCFEIGKKYLKRIELETAKFDILIGQIEQEWENEATGKPIEIICEFCNTPTGRFKDDQTDSIICQNNQCRHRIR